MRLKQMFMIGDQLHISFSYDFVNNYKGGRTNTVTKNICTLVWSYLCILLQIQIR
jgi:hypothetical protein